MKKYLKTIVNGVAALFAVVSYLLLLGPVFAKASYEVSALGGSTGWQDVAEFASGSFYEGLGENGYNGGYKGVGITIIVLLGVALLCTIFLIVLDFVKAKKELKFVNYVVAVLFIAAGVMTFFLAMSTSGNLVRFETQVLRARGSIDYKYTLGACPIIAGILMIISGLAVAVAPMLSKKAK